MNAKSNEFSKILQNRLSLSAALRIAFHDIFLKSPGFMDG